MCKLLSPGSNFFQPHTELCPPGKYVPYHLLKPVENDISVHDSPVLLCTCCALIWQGTSPFDTYTALKEELTCGMSCRARPLRYKAVWQAAEMPTSTTRQSADQRPNSMSGPCLASAGTGFTQSMHHTTCVCSAGFPPSTGKAECYQRHQGSWLP